MIGIADCGCIITHILDNDARVVCMGTDCPYCALEIESEIFHCPCCDFYPRLAKRGA